MDLKSFIKSQTALKAVARWLLQPSHDFRPRWWVRVFVNPFVHRISRKAIRRWSARLDVVPFQAFSVGPYSILESQSLISNACGAVILGEKVLLGVGSVVIGPAVLDNNILIAQNVVISALNHDFEDVSRPIIAQGYSVKTVHIETGVWIGAGAVVTQGVRIGQNAVVGAGSVVTKDVPPFSVVVGNPARLVKQYNPKTGIWEKIN